MICSYHGAIRYARNSALSSYIHITTVEVVQSNEPWRMSAGCRRSCCTLMTPSSGYEELRSSLTWILQGLILPAPESLVSLMAWKGKRTKSRGFRLSDCNFDRARRAAWQVVDYRCFRQSEFYLIFLIKAWAQPSKMQHVFIFSN